VTQLNIGAGRTHLPGFVNIDIAPWADVTLDIGRDRLPFADDSIDLAFSYHTLEHVSDYLFALGEIHRVCRHGAPVLLGLPYVTLTEYHLVNPYHVHNFNEHSFDFFDPDKLVGSAVEEVGQERPVLFRQGWSRMNYMGRFGRLPEPAKTWCRRHLFNVVRSIDFGLVALKQDVPVRVPAAGELQRQFDTLLLKCKPYPARGRARPGAQD
jgi:SAM-dependent methyltransferase